MTFTRRVLSGSAQISVSNGAVRLLSLLTMPILTTLLSPQAYGVAALLGTIIALMSVFALAGIDVTYARTYHSTQTPNGIIVERFCWRFAIGMAMTAAMPAAVGWWFLAKDFVELDRRLAIVLFGGIILSVISTMAQTRARLASKYQALALTAISGGLIGAVGSLCIANWWRQDALALVFPVLCSSLISLLFLGSPSITELLRPSGLVRGQGVVLVNIGLSAIVTAPMFWLLSSLDRWFIQYYHGAEAVGIYAMGYSIATVGMIVNSAVTSAWLPEASREYELDQERAKYTLGRVMSRLLAAMAIIWFMVTAAGGDIVRWLADVRFHSSGEFVPFIAGGVLFYGASQLALHGLILIGEFKRAAYWWLIGGLFCAVLNFLLVPCYGGLGAAITQTASFALICIGIFYTSQARYRIQLDWNRLAPILATILAAGLLLTQPWHVVASLSLLMKLPIGISVASMTSWIIAPDWCIRGMTYLSKARTA